MGGDERKGLLALLQTPILEAGGGGSEMRVGNEDKDGEHAMGCPHWPIDERQLRATSGSQHSICLPSGSINPRWEPLI